MPAHFPYELYLMSALDGFMTMRCIILAAYKSTAGGTHILVA